MEHFFSLVQSVVIIVVLISITFWLKKRNIVHTKDSMIFSKLVTEFTLPALIFSSLATQAFAIDRFVDAFLMLVALLFSLAIAFAAGKIIKLKNIKLGAFIITAGFGNALALGYPLIKQVFNNNSQAMARCVRRKFSPTSLPSADVCLLL